jgi:hypothetical protein
LPRPMIAPERDNRSIKYLERLRSHIRRLSGHQCNNVRHRSGAEVLARERTPATEY